MLSPAPAAKRPAENTLLRGVKLAWHNLALAARGVVIGVGWAFPLLVARRDSAYVIWRLSVAAEQWALLHRLDPERADAGPQASTSAGRSVTLSRRWVCGACPSSVRVRGPR